MTRGALAAACGVLLLGRALAAAPPAAVVENWVADPARSTLGFTATQEGAPFDGRFHRFSTGLELLQSPDGIELVEIGTRIELDSVDTQYGERDEYLATEEWFNLQVFPAAEFRSRSIRQLGNNRFIADGELALRGISQNVPVEMEITIEANGERGHLTGQATLNRLDFGVGQGEWASTEWVGATVDVKFDLYILRAFE